MLPQLLALAGTFTLTLATAIFHPPKGESFLSIDYRVGIPLNTTTPDGVVGTVPVLGGDIKGKFNGHIVGNITSSIERALVSTTGVYTSYDGRYLFENDAGERIMTEVVGTTTYSKVDLHGLGYATFATDIEDLRWINYAMFIAEWQGNFEKGNAVIEIFELTTGGRIDGEPIHAVMPKVPDGQ